jgi:hypothetical protein
MDPRHNNNEIINLPSGESEPDINVVPDVEKIDAGRVTEQALGRAVEGAMLRGQSSSPTNLTTDNSTATLPLSSVLDDSAQPFTPDPKPSQPVSFKLSAKEAELIEKQWVIKAKAIVEHTKGDPFQQDREVSKMKADYLKKRYNKELKVDA